jgi:hypothetical protein
MTLSLSRPQKKKDFPVKEAGVAVMLQSYIQGVLSPNLGWGTDYSDRNFHQPLQANGRVAAQLGHDCLYQNPFQSTIHQLFYHLMLYSLDIDRTTK